MVTHEMGFVGYIYYKIGFAGYIYRKMGFAGYICLSLLIYILSTSFPLSTTTIVPHWMI